MLEFIDGWSGDDAAAVVAAMKEVSAKGLNAAQHLRGDIWEVKADGDRQTFRIVFAPVGRRHHVLLDLAGFSKKTRRTPPQVIGLAERRLRAWRERGRRQS